MFYFLVAYILLCFMIRLSLDVLTRKYNKNASASLPHSENKQKYWTFILHYNMPSGHCTNILSSVNCIFDFFFVFSKKMSS